MDTFVLTVLYTGASMSSDKPNDLKLNIKPWTLGVWGFLFILLIFIRKKLYFIMNSLQKALYDYALNSSCKARGAANELVKKFGVHDFYTTDPRALASECGSWILEPINIAQNEMYENGYTDIVRLSKSELREVAEEVMSYLFTKKRERMGDKRSLGDIMKKYNENKNHINIDKIITEAIDKICNTSI